jgi:hypothetical protein
VAKRLEVVFAAVPVAFNGGPLDRQVHVWSEADVWATEVLWVDDDRSGGYSRSSTWRTQQEKHRPVTYSWSKVDVRDYLDMPTYTVPPEAVRRS